MRSWLGSVIGRDQEPESSTTALDRFAGVSSVQVRTFLARFSGMWLRVGAGLVTSRPGGSLRMAWRGVVLDIGRLGTPAIVSGRGFLSGSGTMRSGVGAPPIDSRQVV